MKIIFTKHAKFRIRKRKIFKLEIIETLKFPDEITKKYDKYPFQKKLSRGIIEICCEKTEKNIKIVTVYWI